MSRLSFQCITCKHSGPRADSYRELPGKYPGFNDVCPRCGSENVDVNDPLLTRRADARDLS